MKGAASVRRAKRVSLGVVVLSVLVAGRAIAPAASLYDFTGHWTGVAQETGKGATNLAADLSTTGTKTFGGALSVEANPPSQCTVKGKQKPNMKVKMRLACGDSTVKLHGTLTPATATVQGKFTLTRHGKHHAGTFTLTKQAV